MTEHSEYLVYLGARDWRQPGWAGGFYPSDMPEEWRLSFYATHFSCVWLDEPAWRTVDPASLQGWLHDVPDGFRFLLAAGDASTATHPPGIPVSESILLCSDRQMPRLVWFDRDTDLRDLAARIQSARHDPPLYLLSRDNDLGRVEQVRTLLELLGL